MGRYLEQIKKKIDSGGPIIKSEKPKIRNSFQRKEAPEDISKEAEEERKARLEYERRLRARAMAKLAMGEHHLTKGERTAVRQGYQGGSLSRLRTLVRDRRLIKKEGKKMVAKKATKKVAKKTATLLASCTAAGTKSAGETDDHPEKV